MLPASKPTTSCEGIVAERSPAWYGGLTGLHETLEQIKRGAERGLEPANECQVAPTRSPIRAWALKLPSLTVQRGRPDRPVVGVSTCRQRSPGPRRARCAKRLQPRSC